MSTAEASFSLVFARALRGEACAVVGLGQPRRLDVARWSAEADTDDGHLLEHCTGPTLDVGCGPGRLASALARGGVAALGIDVVPEAVEQTRSRGAAALQRDVFDDLPAEGAWGTVLLADGNIGIGGDPAALLARARRLVAARGRVVVETSAASAPLRSAWARLECAGLRSRPFRWATLGGDTVSSLADEAGLRTVAGHRFGERWCTVLERAA